MRAESASSSTPITKATAVVCVFAKAPIPGSVKTRLVPALSAEHAAFLHMAMTERALATARRVAQVELCCAPDNGHAFFSACAEDFAVNLAEQGEGDLGVRLATAFSRLLETHARVLVIGADCPALTVAHLRAAIAALDDADVVLIPAEDGGYVLIGARRLAPGAFDHINWGSAEVLVQQRQKLVHAGLRLAELPALWDVDLPQDLARVRALKPPLEFFWPD